MASTGGNGTPPRGEWSFSSPTRAPGSTQRDECSAPPTPRALRTEWSHNAPAAISFSERVPLPRPESLSSFGGVDRDKSTLKVHLPNGGFNVVKFGDATDIKVNNNNGISKKKDNNNTVNEQNNSNINIAEIYQQIGLYIPTFLTILIYFRVFLASYSKREHIILFFSVYVL